MGQFDDSEGPGPKPVRPQNILDAGTARRERPHGVRLGGEGRVGPGVAIFARSLVPDDLRELPPTGMPDLGEIDLVLLTKQRNASKRREALTAIIAVGHPIMTPGTAAGNDTNIFADLNDGRSILFRNDWVSVGLIAPIRKRRRMWRDAP